MATLEIRDRGAAAYLLAAGIPFVRFVPGAWALYLFQDDQGAATAALNVWRDGTATTNARAFWEAFKNLRNVATTTFNLNLQGVSNHGSATGVR